MKHLQFSLAEKLAVINAVEDVILADGKVDNREIGFMKQLSYFLNFDMNLIEESRKMNQDEVTVILRGMPRNKKQALSLMIKEMASADGKVDDEELRVIYNIFDDAGINS